MEDSDLVIRVTLGTVEVEDEDQIRPFTHDHFVVFVLPADECLQDVQYI